MNYKNTIEYGGIKMKSVVVNCDIDRAIGFISRFITGDDEKREILGVRNYRILMGDMFYSFVNRNTKSCLHMNKQQKARGGRVKLNIELPNVNYTFVCECDH